MTYFNNVKKRQNERKRIEAAGKSSAFHDSEKCYHTMKKAVKLWALFSGEPANGRDLFRRENQDSIRQLASKMDAKAPQGQYSAALAKLWDEAEQDDWERRAQLSIDVAK